MWFPKKFKANPFFRPGFRRIRLLQHPDPLPGPVIDRSDDLPRTVGRRLRRHLRRRQLPRRLQAEDRRLQEHLVSA